MRIIKTNLNGLSANVDMTKEGIGAGLNKMIKTGIIDASDKAKVTNSNDELHKKLAMCNTNVTAIRHDSFPEGLVLRKAVDLLTESYREPLLNLLEQCGKFLMEQVNFLNNK